MHPAFARIDHRPWDIPSRPWTWRQTWRDLAFIHWPVPSNALRRLIPEGLEIQEFEGTSWVGLVPFRMTGVMRRYLPDVPGVSAFPELNLRLYVEAQGKPGVWFLSLDAQNHLAVWAARRFFHLPYYYAEMSLRDDGTTIDYFSQRRSGARPTLRVRYRPTSDVYQAKAGTLEHWLTERYCLYARSPDGRLLRNDVHHVPWPLQRGEAELTENSMLAPHGIQLQTEPLVHFARRVDVAVWDAESCQTNKKTQAKR